MEWIMGKEGFQRMRLIHCTAWTAHEFVRRLLDCLTADFHHTNCSGNLLLLFQALTAKANYSNCACSVQFRGEFAEQFVSWKSALRMISDGLQFPVEFHKIIDKKGSMKMGRY